MAICQEARESVKPYKIVPNRGGYGVSIVVHSYIIQYENYNFLKFSAAFGPIYFKCKNWNDFKREIVRYIQDKKL